MHLFRKYIWAYPYDWIHHNIKVIFELIPCKLLLFEILTTHTHSTYHY